MRGPFILFAGEMFFQSDPFPTRLVGRQIPTRAGATICRLYGVLGAQAGARLRRLPNGWKRPTADTWSFTWFFGAMAVANRVRTRRLCTFGAHTADDRGSAV